jgi:mRNA interferase HigB
MWIVTHSTLVAYAKQHPNAQSALDTWYRRIKQGGFHNLAELHSVFPSADLVGQYIVFNIGGNNERLITVIHWNTQKIYLNGVKYPLL